MPSTMTHCYFAQDVYNKINSNSRKKINGFLDKLLTFSMGSDPFMFYHFFVGKKNKEIANIQKTVHTEKTNEYFYNIIDYIIKNNLTNDKEIISFLYGMICHYFLDKNTHPFIYYKSGIFDKNNSDTYKYNTLHHKIEYAIDIYMIKKLLIGILGAALLCCAAGCAAATGGTPCAFWTSWSVGALRCGFATSWCRD